MLRSPLLSQLPHFDHGFGTRQAPLSQDGMASLQQIHSAVILSAAGAGCLGEGDALVTNQPGVTVSIRTADCYPILLADPVSRAAAAIHAGWRGTAAGIVAAALRRMEQDYKTNPSDVYASIGPGIGACCYEVGIEVARQFGLNQAGPLDLAAENHRQLLDAGLAPERIDVLGLCTRCDAQNFHSFRRDKEAAGRMISFIALK